MGLLTDPTAGQGQLTKLLLKYYGKLCVLLYIGSIAYFLGLIHPQFNLNTYFSENALLPGLVHTQFRDDASAKSYYYELLEEMKVHKEELPYSWLLAKFQQLGLDTYTHNFTLNYPLGTSQKFTGKNVYGILRAARAASVESLVVTVPYRTPRSMHETTAPAVAIMLAFAKFANKEKYWAKDIIFLVTEHEQLGIQAWLEAYHSVTSGKRGVLNSGDLIGRAGAIQAAINLEFHATDIGHIDVKIEGLNGQLPNLDLFNLVNRICVKEVTEYTFKNNPPKNIKDPFKNYLYHAKTLMAMIATQATGIPNGNHGLFHRFGIEALTMEGFSKVSPDSVTAGFLIQGRIIEGILRSLNNLLERMHQSYFFYLLTATNKFLSISLYMPCVCMMIAALFVKACAIWFQLQKKDEDNEEEEEEEEEHKTKPHKKASKKSRKSLRKLYETELSKAETPELPTIKIIILFIICHLIGLTIMNLPPTLTKVGLHFNLNTESSVFYGFTVISVTLLTLPILTKTLVSQRGLKILNMFGLLELGIVLICIAMNNFSLALFCTSIAVPFALLIGQTNSSIRRFLQKFFWFLVHPLLVVIACVVVYTFVAFKKDRVAENLERSLGASQQALVFAVVDSMIYGNWLFNVVSCFFVPLWLCFWCIAFTPVETKSSIEVKKKQN